MGTSVGEIFLDIRVVNTVAKQVSNIAAQADAQAKSAFSQVGKNAGKTMSDNFSSSAADLKKSMSSAASSASEAFTPLNRATENARIKVESLKEQINALDMAMDNIAANKTSELSDFYSGDGLDAQVEKALAADNEYQKLYQRAQALDIRLNEAKKKYASEAALYQDKLRQDEVKKETAAVNKMQAVRSAGYSNVKSAASSAAMDTKNSLSGAAKAASDVAKRETKKMSGFFSKLGKAIKGTFKAVFITASLYAAFRALKSMFTGAMADNKEFAKSLNEVKANLNVAFTPIIQAVMPALTWLMNGLASVTKSIAAFISGLFGKTYAESVAATKKLQGVSDTAKKTSKSLGLASFDELNTLSKGDSGESENSGGIDYGTIDTGGTEAAEGLAVKVKDIFGKIKDSVVNIVTETGKKLSPSFAAWGTAFNRIKGPAMEAFSSVGNSLNGLWQDTLSPYYDYLVGDWIPGIANSFSETFAPIFGDLMTVQMQQFALDFQFYCDQMHNYTEDILKPRLEGIKTVATDVFAGVKTAWDTYGGSILDGFTRFKESLRQIWQTLYDNVFKPVFEGVGKTLSDLWTNHLKPLWNNITMFVGSLWDCILTLWNNLLAPLVDFIIKKFGPPITTTINIIGSVIGTAFGVIADIIGGIMKTFRGLLDFITGVFSGNWSKAWEGIQTAFGGIWDAMWGIVRGAINLIIDGVNSLWSAIYYAVKGIIDTFGGISGFIGGLFGQDWSFSMPDRPALIPKLANGGIVAQPTLAMVGEYSGAKSNPEVIAPLNKLQSMLGGNVSPEVISMLARIVELLEIIAGKDFHIGDDEIGDAALRSIWSEFKRTGLSPVP